MSLATHDTGPIDSYIAKRKDSEMSKWDVFIPSVERNLTNDSLKVVDFEIGLEERTCNLHDKYDDCTCIALSHKGKVAGRGVERVGLTTEEIERCINDYKKSRAYEIAQKRRKKNKNGVPDSIFRIRGRKPLLVLHFIKVKDISEETKQLGQSELLKTLIPTAWSISFPKTNLADDNVEYQVNSTYIRQLERIDD